MTKTKKYFCYFLIVAVFFLIACDLNPSDYIKIDSEPGKIKIANIPNNFHNNFINITLHENRDYNPVWFNDIINGRNGDAYSRDNARIWKGQALLETYNWYSSPFDFMYGGTGYTGSGEHVFRIMIFTQHDKSDAITRYARTVLWEGTAYIDYNQVTENVFDLW